MTRLVSALMILKITREHNPWSIRVTAPSGATERFRDDLFITEYWTQIPRDRFDVPEYLAAHMDVRAQELGLSHKETTA